jgi:hypothetical protein
VAKGVGDVPMDIPGARSPSNGVLNGLLRCRRRGDELLVLPVQGMHVNESFDACSWSPVDVQALDGDAAGHSSRVSSEPHSREARP